LLVATPTLLRYKWHHIPSNFEDKTMTLKDWVDLLTSGGAAISAIAAGVAAWAARTSARAAKESSEATRAAIDSSERIADNDRRIRLMEARMSVWRAYDNLLASRTMWGLMDPEDILKANETFQLAPFLFPSEVSEYLTLFVATARRQNELFETINCRDVFPVPNNNAKQQEELDVVSAWVERQRHDGKALFQKHMSLIN
jgi:hypothetical protein